jgi:hypothetical protein
MKPETRDLSDAERSAIYHIAFEMENPLVTITDFIETLYLVAKGLDDDDACCVVRRLADCIKQERNAIEEMRSDLLERTRVRPSETTEAA